MGSAADDVELRGHGFQVQPPGFENPTDRSEGGLSGGVKKATLLA